MGCSDVQKEQTEDKNSVPTDFLKILYLMTFGVIRLRFVKFLLVVIFIFHSTIGAIQIIDLLMTFDGLQLLQYGPCFLVSCSCLVNIAAILSAERLLSKIFIKLAISRFWTLDRFPADITSKIVTESKLITVATVGDFSVLFSFTAIHIPLFGDKNVIYGLLLFEKAGKMAEILRIVYYVTLPILAYVAFMNGGVIIYTLMHVRFYIFVINHHLKQLFDSDDDYGKLVNEEYQNGVFVKLKASIERHQCVKMIEKKLNDKLLPSLVLLLYLSIAGVISMLMNILSDSSKFGFVLAISSMTVTLITPALVVHVGQILKNEYDKMFENVLKFPWLVWDTRNRKVLLFFMKNLQKSFLLGKAGLLLCEYSFIPSVLSFLWTVSTFIIEVGSRK